MLNAPNSNFFFQRYLSNNMGASDNAKNSMGSIENTNDAPDSKKKNVIMKDKIKFA